MDRHYSCEGCVYDVCTKLYGYQCHRFNYTQKNQLVRIPHTTTCWTSKKDTKEKIE